MTAKPTARVYIDGFNLYYGSMRRSAHKWLNLQSLCDDLLPAFQVELVRYFTARAASRPTDPDVNLRQQVYLRALETLPNLEIHYGSFLTKTTKMVLASSPPLNPQFVEVIKTEEKGSDVNLASHLLLDAARDRADAFVVISNDSDLMEPIRIVRQEFGKTVGIINPHQHPSYALMKCGPNFTKRIRQGALAANQFPDPVVAADGSIIQKPSSWA